MDSLQLNSGVNIPAIGFGLGGRTRVKDAYSRVLLSINAGYHYFDSAQVYLNESEVGHAFKDSFVKGLVKRQDIFVSSKLWPTHFRAELARSALIQTLNDLGVENLDLYLLHTPFSLKNCDNKFGRLVSIVEFDDVDYLDAWRTLEQFHREGLVRHIGVSNFNRFQLERLFANCRILPEVLQCESHPYFQNERLFAFARSHGVLCVAYSPFLTGAAFFEPGPDDPRPLEDSVICEIAHAHHRSPAQIILRWQNQRGNAVVCTSSSPQHMQENLKIWDFTLSAEEMARIAALERGVRYNTFAHAAQHPYYPFHDVF